MKVVNYIAEPTLRKFHSDNSFVRGVMGAIGSGKSVACCMEIINRARKQKPDANGIRRSRWAVIRNTYGELKSTTIKTWESWFDSPNWKIVYDSPIRGMLKVPMQDGTTIELEMLFLALDRPDQAKKLLSLELTGAWINEAREIPRSIVDNVTSRLDRFPSAKDGGATWTGMIMDTNPPDTDHWWYKLAEEETPQGWRFFRQPPALLYDEINGYYPNPAAENISHHTNGYGYYLNQLGGKTKEWIKVYIQAEYGTSIEGKPVYPEYNDSIHCATSDLLPIQKIPLLVSFDFGLTPAACISQVTPSGQFRVIDEIPSANMGIQQFMTDLLMPKLNSEYKEFLTTGSIYMVGDPAGNQRAQTDETTCIQVINSFGFKCEGAHTNSFLARREAVANRMLRLIDGQPAFIISPKCKFLRRGFLGGYRYQKVSLTTAEKYKDEPEKNMFSHIQDALQYGVLKASISNLVYGKYQSSHEDADYDNISFAGAM